MARMQNLIVEPHPNPDLMRISRMCPECKQKVGFTITHHDWYEGTGRLNEGATMQRAFPTLSPDQREILITGICNRCFDAITHD